jgi:hypothetical protein
MTLFRSFTTPAWEIFIGNLLLLLCTIFYIAWWTTDFKPNPNNGPSGGIFIGLAFVTGTAALALMSHGIGSLSEYTKGLQIKFLIAGSAALFVVMLLVTVIAFHRIVTSELIIIHIWTALELCAVAVLYGTERFGGVSAVIMYALTGLAFATGIICYVVYYRLDETGRYWIGLVPIAADAFVSFIFAGILAVF